MSKDLKPCPFCSGEAEVIRLDDGMYQCICRKCGGVWNMFFDFPEEAVYAWNSRPIEDEKDKENKRLCEALDEIVNRNDFSRYCDGSQLDKAIEDFNIQIDAIPLIRIAQRALKG